MSQTQAGSTSRARPAMAVDDVVDAVLASSRALVALSARSIASANDVTLPQYRMLVVLDSRTSNLTELAEALDVAPSTAMRMVDRLEAAGLVERTVPPDNRRVTHLRSRPRGGGPSDSHRPTPPRPEEGRRAGPGRPAYRFGRAMTAFAEAAERLWPMSTAE